MKHPSLTTKSVKAATGGPREIVDGATPGLYLVVGRRGPVSWALRYVRPSNRKTARLVVGRACTGLSVLEGRAPKLGDRLTLKEARELALALQRRIGDGVDPGEDAAFHKKDTWSDVVGRYFGDPKVQLNRNWEGARRIVLKDTGDWDKLLVRRITRKHVRDALDRATKRSPSAGNNLKAQLGPVFRWCVERELIEASPVRDVSTPMPIRKRERKLGDDELAYVWAAADDLGKLLILTGQRLGEVESIQAGDVVTDGPAPTWTIPGQIAKNGIEHRVALAPAAVDVLRPALADKDRPFANPNRSRWRTAWRERVDAARVDDGLEPLPLWRPHDLRRTVASNMAAMGVPVHVTELVLNHRARSLGGVVGVYQQHDYAQEQRAALLRWAERVEAVVRGESNIVNLNA